MEFTNATQRFKLCSRCDRPIWCRVAWAWAWHGVGMGVTWGWVWHGVGVAWGWAWLGGGSILGAVSKRVEDGRRPANLQAGHQQIGHEANSGVACLQGVERSGMASPGETLGSPSIPLAIRACSLNTVCRPGGGKQRIG
jgi:hypothetical protein